MSVIEAATAFSMFPSELTTVCALELVSAMLIRVRIQVYSFTLVFIPFLAENYNSDDSDLQVKQKVTS
jgi:hypothetical protein